MTERKTDTALDFTLTQVVDALRNDGWDIPTSPAPAPKIEGSRLVLTWATSVPETPTP